MIRCLVVDDEPLVRERLRTLLAGHPDMTVVAECEDGLCALEALRQHTPDAVFLDIQMPGLTGLEVAEAWRREAELPAIVFVTAFDQFALEAFRVNALDYLTKPIDPERFAEALDRVRRMLAARTPADQDQRVRAMLEMHERRRTVRPHIVVREHDRYLLVSCSEIQALEATGNYVTLHADKAKHLVRATMTSIESRLDPQRFVRTHRSWIVNLDRVREVQPWAKGSWVLVTRSGLEVPVGQQYREVLDRLLS